MSAQGQAGAALIWSATAPRRRHRHGRMASRHADRREKDREDGQKPEQALERHAAQLGAAEGAGNFQRLEGPGQVYFILCRKGLDLPVTGTGTGGAPDTNQGCRNGQDAWPPRSSPCRQGDGSGRSDRPGVRDARGPGDDAASRKPRWAGLSFLLGQMPRALRGPARNLPRRIEPRSRAGAEGRDLHLSDASPDRADRPGDLSDLRNGTRAAKRVAHRGSVRGTDLDMRRRFVVSALLERAAVVLVMLRHFWPMSVERWARAPSTGSSLRWRRRWCCGRGWPFFVRGWQ